MPFNAIEHYINCTDEALLLLVSKNEVDALDSLYDRYAYTVYQLLLNMTREPTVTEELLQDTFCHIWQKAEQFRGSGSAAAWLSRIARNKARDYLRRQRCRPQADKGGLDKFEATLTPYGPGVQEAVEWRGIQQAITSALDKLPKAQRECLELAYFDGLSQTEIAAYTHVPLGTIKTRLRTGRDKIERFLRAMGYSESCATTF